MASSSFHEGELRVQRLAGVADRAARVAKIFRADIPPRARDFVAVQPWIVLGATDDEDRTWATILDGKPGFARAVDERTLEVTGMPAAGDPLAPTLTPGRELGVLAIELATRRRMRVNGTMLPHRDEASAGVRLRTDQVYSNCPKYIQARDVAFRPRPGGAAATRIEKLTALDTAAASWIERADTFFIASHVPGRGADASHRGGPPGFVRVEGDRLSWPDYVGNAMFNTLGNIALRPEAGLLFVDFSSGDLLHLTGTAALDADPRRAAAWPGGERVVDFHVDEAWRRRGALRLVFGPPDPSPFLP